MSADADVKIEKMTTPVKIGAGEQVKYTLWASNLGPSDATNVVVTDTLPAGVTFVSTSGCVVEDQ